MTKYTTYLFLLLFLSCCSNPENKEEKTPEGTGVKQEPTEVTKPVPQKHAVSITGMKFIPEVITVHKGDTIVFTNSDIVDHDVTEEKTKAWTSSVIHSGGSWRMVATQSVDYFCSIHVVMKGKIVVE